MSLVLSLGACAVGRGNRADNPRSGSPPDKLAVPARPLATTAPAARGGTTTTAAVAGSPTSTTVKGGGTTTTTTTNPYVSRLDVADRTGDAGLQSKPYGDLTRVRLEDDGTRARVTVEVAGALPTPFASDEQLHVGVDLYRGHKESDYQLYAEGTSDGWRAWLYDAKGAVAYTGTFEVGADILVFTMPWPSLGGRAAGSLAAFADWDKQGTVVGQASEDHAPDTGSTPFSF